MLVVCPNCQTRYQLDDGKMSGSKFSVRCARCKQVFSAFNPVEVEQVRFLDLEAARKNFDHDHIITISNQKGGVAKTSTCLNLGLSLALHDKRVLLIDFDIQANLTISLGYKETTSFYDVVNGGGQSMEQFIVETKYPNLSLFPSNKNMVLLNKKFFGAKHFEFILKDRLLPLKERLHYHRYAAFHRVFYAQCAYGFPTCYYPKPMRLSVHPRHRPDS
jgi:chromosome partitioning protein